MKKQKLRPVNLDLPTMHFPITAITSILHRVSGVILFIAVGILLWLLAQSLSSPIGFLKASQLVDTFMVKFVLWGILTALFYHIVVGVRHIMMDMGHFEELVSGELSAKVAIVIAVVLSLFAGVLVW